AEKLRRVHLDRKRNMGRAGLILWGIVGAPGLAAPHVVELTTRLPRSLTTPLQLVPNGGMAYYKQE
ncbi:hypothetical protein COCCADRAFT_91544, partial [Bipolaris zeicola 26-R-13]